MGRWGVLRCSPSSLPSSLSSSIPSSLPSLQGGVGLPSSVPGSMTISGSGGIAGAGTVAGRGSIVGGIVSETGSGAGGSPLLSRYSPPFTSDGAFFAHPVAIHATSSGAAGDTSTTPITPLSGVPQVSSSNTATGILPPASGASNSNNSNSTESDGDDDEAVADAVGQLSLNEDSQVRFHGKVSGLHLLGQRPRVDGRNRGGIW